jgi:aspartyl-tRNA(Asn)/glutamyl-tRNA(Gln) amidotransferase subunit A
VGTTGASALFKDRIPGDDAEVVRRLKTACGVFLGKTNMREFAYRQFLRGRAQPLGDEPHGGRIVRRFCCGFSPRTLLRLYGLGYLGLHKDSSGSLWLRTDGSHRGRHKSDASGDRRNDPQDITSEEMKMPDYRQALGTNVSSLRIGAPREFFFAELDTEVEAALKEAHDGVGTSGAPVSVPP